MDEVGVQPASSEGGFTLVELMVYSILLAVVISIVGGLLINFLKTESTVRAVTSASTAAQLAADSVETGVRTSSAFEVQSANAGADQMLLARVARGTGTSVSWKCAAWYFSASQGTIRYFEATPAASGISTIGVPSSSTLSTWILLADRVTASTGTAIFSGSMPTLSMSFTSRGGAGQPPVAISSSVASRSEKVEGSTCFSLTD